MEEEKTVDIKWLTDKFDYDLINHFEELKYNMLSMLLSEYNEIDNILEYDSIESHIDFDNEIIKTRNNRNSKFSPGATIAALSQNAGYKEFVIPPDIIDWINETIISEEDYQLYLNTLPTDEEYLELGRDLYDICIEKGFPSQAAYMLCGAFWVECRFNPNVFNAAEQSGSEGTVVGARNLSGCGEGLFQLTFWKQKIKYIEKMHLDTQGHEMYPVNLLGKVDKFGEIFDGLVENNESTYNKIVLPSGKGHLYQLTEEVWIDIFNEYISSMNPAAGDDKSPIEYLMYSEQPKGNSDSEDEDHKLLYTGYLFKAAPGESKTIEAVKRVTEKYMNTHQKIRSSKGYYSKVTNGFIQQILCAYLLSLYFYTKSIDELSFKDIITISEENVQITSGNIQISGNGIRSKVSGLFSNSSTNNFIEPDLNDDLFKRNDHEYHIDDACDWLEKNAHNQSKHICAKYVRHAIEVGFSDKNATAGRPNWAWQYINFLPTIGFKFIQKVHKGDDYIPLKGDICVYYKNNNPNVPGHICMYTGNYWCSDFKQANMFVYRNTKEGYIFRFEK